MEMTQTKKDIYKKAYSELNEIFNSALSFEIERIPANVLENMRAQIDTEYNWNYDYSKNLMDQDMMPETKALLVEFYARYLCPDEERVRWENYNNICTELIEEERIKRQEQNKIFGEKEDESNQIECGEINFEYDENKEESSDSNMLFEKSEKKSIFSKIMEALKNILKK